MSRMRRISLLTAVACTLIPLITGCSKSGPKPATNSASAPSVELPKPCSLITQEEAESALGRGATMTASTNPRTSVEECAVKPAKGTELDHLTIVLHDTTAESWETVKKSHAQDVTPIPGLGDDAINVGMYGVWVRKGNVYLQIYGAIDNQRNEKAELFLAAKAVSRM